MNNRDRINVVLQLRIFLGPNGVRWFRHLKGLFGTVSPVIRMNVRRKGVPVYPVHFRDGMTIRNFLRTLPECRNLNLCDEWAPLVELAVKDAWRRR